MLKINSEFIEIGIGLKVPLCSVDLYDTENKPSSENFHPADFKVTALMLNENMSITSKDDFVYFGSREHIEFPDKGHMRPRSGDSSIYGSLWWMNTPGGILEKEFLDDENLYWFPNKTKEEINTIKIHLSLFKGNDRFNELNSGPFNNKCRFYIKIYQGKKNDEIVKFDFTEDYSGFDTLELGCFKKINNQWFFEHSGLPAKGGLRYLINKYAENFS